MRIRSLLFLLLIPFLLTAFTQKIPAPIVENGDFNNQLPKLYIAGAPNLPFFPVRILVPMGQKVEDVQVSSLTRNELSLQTEINYSRLAQPLSKPNFQVDPGKDMAIYNSNEFYPAKDYEVLGSQFQNGYQILLINLYPYKYNPSTGTISWSEEMEIDFSSIYDSELNEKQNRFLLSNSRKFDEISELVLNPEAVHSYNKSYTASSRELPNSDDPYEMIIITSETITDYFAEFISWKNAQGVSTGIFTVEEIFANYEGENEQAKVRNFVIDAYTAYSSTSTPLEYVLLGGDDELVPERGAYGEVGSYVDYGIPCDMYYANLDGNWDENGNGVYGEMGDNNDLLPEIAVGRITCETQEEFDNFFQKNYTYVDEANVSNDVVYFIGENLNNDPLTWGGDYTDEIEPVLEDGFHLFRLYEREGTFSGANVREAINSGLSIINHMGHANETMVMGQTPGSLNSYNNTEFGFTYSQGCYPAAFDEATSGAGESIAENFILNEHALYAFVGNTRYGWYYPGSTDGASQFFAREFFAGMFDENIRQLGKTNNYSKIQLVNEAMSSNVMRWCYYELSLFGDPSISVKSPNGGFPFVQPAASSFDDFSGDGDGMVNPGETINLNVTLENLEGWADAENVYAKVSFENSEVELVQDSVYFGSIINGDIADGVGSFVVNVPQSCGYEAMNYNLQVVAPISEGVRFERNYTLNFEVSLFQAGWPWSADGTVVSNPAIYDIDGDQQMEAVVSKIDASLFIMDALGEELPGWPLAQDEYLWRSFAIADLDGDESEEIVFASRNNRIFAVNSDGDEILDYQSNCGQLLTPVVADINNDGTLDIISYGIDTNITAIDASGNVLAGFPFLTESATTCELAVADLNTDGSREIIFAGVSGDVQVITSTGSMLAGFPVNLGSPIFGAPIVLDNRSIVIGTNDNKLFVLGADGEILSERAISGKVANSAIAADFDNDDQLEIAFSTTLGAVYILEQNGDILPGWPVQMDMQVSNPPVAADFNNDGLVDLAVSASVSDLYIYHADGSLFEFAPVPLGFTGNTPASIGDLDADGDWDIIAGNSYGAYVVDAKLPKGEKIPWRTYRGNYFRTGFYGDNELSSVTDLTPEIPKYALTQNYPNPFNPTTRIKFALKQSEKVRVDVFNLKGQKVKTLLNKVMNEGEHEIVWNGKDSNNKSVSSGIYFYKMSASRYSNVKKMILLK